MNPAKPLKAIALVALEMGMPDFWWGPPKKIICSFEFGEETTTYLNSHERDTFEILPQWDFAIEVFDRDIAYQRIYAKPGSLDIIDAKINNSLIKFEFDWMAPFYKSIELVTVIINRKENIFTWR